MVYPIKPHCKYGHALTPDNVKLEVNARGTQRRCIQCRRQRDRERYRDKPQRREQVQAAWHAYRERAACVAVTDTR